MSGFDLRANDTVVALATARGKSAIAVVRVAGPAAFALRDRIFRRRRSGPIPPFVVVRGDVVDDDGSVVDDGLCVSFKGPRSYTGGDVVEFSLHGSALVVDLVVGLLLRHGARAAEPGELTLRAVLAGRLDLAAAEAVDAVVGARSVVALQAAQRALRGGLAAKIEGPRAALVDVLAELEARLDFPDEDLGEAARGALRARVHDARAALAVLVDGARRGRRLVDGARVVLYGPPNAGKSTLLNALVGSARALVHDEPGTTRDALEAEVEFGGVACVVVDVAGVRDVKGVHAVEVMGIARAHAEVARADVVVVLSPAGADAFPPPATPATVLTVTSKIDLVAGASGISAKTGAGLDALRADIARALGAAGIDDDEALVQTARQEGALRDAVAALDAAVVEFAGDAEVVCADLRGAARALDRLLGRDVSVDVLDLVFSRFCIGK